MLEPRIGTTAHPLPTEGKWSLMVSEGTILGELWKDKLSPATSDEARLS